MLPSGRRRAAYRKPSRDQTPGNERATLTRAPIDAPEHGDEDVVDMPQTFTYSPDGVLGRKDFRELSREQAQDARRLMAKLSWSANFSP